MNRDAILKKLDDAGKKADHLPNTRATYRRVISYYLDLVDRKLVGDFQGFLDYVAVNGSPSSVRLALNAGVFFCSNVLGRERPVFRIPRAKKKTRIPVFLSHSECLAVFSFLNGEDLLKAQLLYGCGLRPSELFALRLKDIDFEAGMLIVRGGKGDKDRTVRLPQAIVPQLIEKVRCCHLEWKRDGSGDTICPVKLPSLQKKLGNRLLGSVAWRWLFASRVKHGKIRWHATTRGFEEAISKAVNEAGITKWITLRTFRHSYATNLLYAGVDLRTLQFQLGHSDVKTTEIYTHAIGSRGTGSPLDRPDIAGNVIRPEWRVSA